MIPTLSIEAFNPKVAELQEMSAMYSGLTISGIDDKVWYTKVHEARMTLKKARVDIEKQSKAFRDEAVQFNKAVIAKEKELIAIIEPTELALADEEKRIDYEVEAKKREAIRKEQERLDERIRKLAAFGESYPPSHIKDMSDDEFDDVLADAETDFQAREQERIAREQKEQAEREAFAREMAALAEKQREIADREAAIVAKEKAAKDEQLAKDRAAEIEKQRKEAADQAARDTEARMKREQEEKEQKEIQDRLNQKMAERHAQDKLEKKKKYIDWLAEHGYTEENKAEFRVDNGDTEVVLWQRVGVFKK